MSHGNSIQHRDLESQETVGKVAQVAKARMKLVFLGLAVLVFLGGLWWFTPAGSKEHRRLPEEIMTVGKKLLWDYKFMKDANVMVYSISKGRFFPGKVVARQSDGLYRIQIQYKNKDGNIRKWVKNFDDEDVLWQLPYSVGDIVETIWNKTWIKAIIVEVPTDGKGEYRMQYLHCEDESHTREPAANIRKNLDYMSSAERRFAELNATINPSVKEEPTTEEEEKESPKMVVPSTKIIKSSSSTKKKMIVFEGCTLYIDQLYVQYLCPISGRVMTDPYMTTDGFSYEKEEIRHYIEQQKENMKRSSFEEGDQIKVIGPNQEWSTAIYEQVSFTYQSGERVVVRYFEENGKPARVAAIVLKSNIRKCIHSYVTKKELENSYLLVNHTLRNIIPTIREDIEASMSMDIAGTIPCHWQKLVEPKYYTSDKEFEAELLTWNPFDNDKKTEISETVTVGKTL